MPSFIHKAASSTRRSGDRGATKSCGQHNGAARSRIGSATATSKCVWEKPPTVSAVDDRPGHHQPIGICSIVDQHSLECLGGLVKPFDIGDRPIDELDRLASQRAHPRAAALRQRP